MNINNLSLEELDRILESNQDYNAIYMNDIVEGYYLPDGQPAGLADIQRRYQELLTPTKEIVSNDNGNNSFTEVVYGPYDNLEYRTPEEIFEEETGLTFDPNVYRIVQNENAYDDGFDNPLSTFNVIQYAPIKENKISKEPIVEEKEEAYDLNLVSTTDFDPVTMTQESEFKRIMGFDYDPNKYEIRISEGVNSLDDGVNEQLQIFEKVPKKIEIKESTTNNNTKSKRKEELEELIKQSHLREQKAKEENNDSLVASERSYRQPLLNELYEINKDMDEQNKKGDIENLSNDEILAKIAKLEKRLDETDKKIVKIGLDIKDWETDVKLMDKVAELGKEIQELKSQLSKKEINEEKVEEPKEEIESIKEEEKKEDFEPKVKVEVKERKLRFRKLKSVKNWFMGLFKKKKEEIDIDVPDKLLDEDNKKTKEERIEKKEEKPVEQKEKTLEEKLNEVLEYNKKLLETNRLIFEDNKKKDEEIQLLKQKIAALSNKVEDNNNVKSMAA